MEIPAPTPQCGGCARASQHAVMAASPVAARSDLLPRPQSTDLPLALVDAAALALQPGFGALAHVAREEIAAQDAVLRIGAGERRNGPARAGARILPWNARRLAVERQRARRRGAGVGEI